MTQDLGLLLMFALVAIIIVVDYIRDGNKPSPGDASCTSEDERCKALRIRQERARQRMKQLGHKSLLEGRKAWATIKPMSDPEPSATVIQFGKKGRK